MFLVVANAVLAALLPLPPGAIARLGDARLRHTSPVAHLSYSADGRRLVTVCNDASVHVWDVRSGLPVARLPAGTAQTAALAGRALVVIDPKGHFKQFDLPDVRRPTRDVRIEGYTGGLAALAPDGGSFVYLHGARDEEHFHVIRIRDWKVTAEIASPRPGLTRSVTFSGDGSRLAFVDGDDEDPDWNLRVHDAVGGKAHFARRVQHPGTVALDRTGSRVAALSTWGVNLTGDWAVWDVAARESVGRGRGLPVALTPDGKRAVVCTPTGAHVADLGGGASRPLRADRLLTRRAIGGAACSPDGKACALTEDGYGVRTYALATGEPDHADEAAPWPGTFQFLADGRLVGWAAGGGSRAWDVRTGRPREPVPTPDLGAHQTVRGYADRVLVARAEGSGPATAWDLSTGTGVRLELPARARPDGRADGRLAPDGSRYLLPLDQPPGVLVYDPATGRLVRRVHFGPGFNGDTLFDAAGRLAVVVPAQRLDGSTPDPRVWDLAAGAERFAAHVAGPGGQATFLTRAWLTPDGRRLLVAVRTFPPRPSRAVAVFDTADGREVGRVRLRPDDEAAAAAPDGRAVVVVAKGVVSVADAVGGRRTLFDDSALAPPQAYLVSPDSRYLVRVGHDRLAHVWDLHAATTAFPSAAAAWDALAQSSAAVAWLAARPAEAGPFIAARVTLPPGLPPAQVAAWVARLGSDVFRDREAAERQLRAVAREHAGPLEEALARAESPEVRRRLERVLAAKDRWEPTPDEVRAARAVEVLERIGSPAARAVLLRVAGGPPSAWATRDALAALDRLAPRP